MKNLLRSILLLVMTGLVSVAYAAGIPPIDVTVSNSKGKVAFKGQTKGDGTFATGRLEPGNYVVQLNSKSPAVKGGEYMIVVAAGKKKVSADGVAGEKLAGGGVAMKVDVVAGTNIAGQVASGNTAAGNGKVRIINGKRYVWQGPETGSNVGGRWVEEGTASMNNVRKGGAEALSNAQDRGSQGVAPGGGQ